jgi:ribosomal protein S12 methylthiotransferase
MRELIDRIKTRVPGIALRTTLIVGYPNETEEAFNELLCFVKDTAFARLGVFTYSVEDGTHAFGLGDPIPADEKERRRDAIMQVQQAISLDHNVSLIGTVQQVMIDELKDGTFIGRTQHSAPEIDNDVFVRSSCDHRPGDFVQVEIEDASEYDLFGTMRNA